MGGSIHPDEFSYRRLGRNHTRTTAMSYPLRRLSSKSTSASTQNENPFETASIISSNASLLSPTPSPNPTPKFVATNKLQIQTPGHGFWALPFVIHNTQTVVFTLDGDGKCERPKWISERREKGKGNFWIADAGDEAGRAVASGVFRWGVGRGKDPRVRVGSGVERDGDADVGDGDGNGDGDVEEFEMKTRWMSRTTTWGWKGRVYQWRYGSKGERKGVIRECGEDCSDLLVLEVIEGGAKGKSMGRPLARFIRGEESRTPGTKRSHAGNGGRLEMAIDEEGSEDNAGLTELVVIATLLVMLKREIDRLRAGQTSAILNSKGTALIAYGIAYAAGCKITD